MAKGLTFKIEGLRDSDLALSQLPLSTAKNVLRRVGRSALEPFDKAWREKAPVKTGKLVKSGGVGSKLSRSQRKQVERASTVEVFAGPGPDPAAVQDEFGNEHQSPQPFVRPAWNETNPKVLDLVASGLRVEIDKTAQRLARKAARLAAKNKA
jgi:HK97 gp10 family phage protein